MERTTTIRASLRDIGRALAIAIVLVILVVFLFLRNGRATLIPSVAVPVSLIGTFGVMYLAGFSINNFTLMALTIATGFVVDDAIVVLENTSRHIEAGMTPFAAALQGAREVGFTVLSMSLSLIAVFIPDPADGRHRRPPVPRVRGHAVGRDPDLARRLADDDADDVRALAAPAGRRARPAASAAWSERAFDCDATAATARASRWALRPRRRRHAGAARRRSCLNVYLYVTIPKGFFPQQDTGRLIGGIQADQSISFQAMREKLADFMAIVGADPGRRERRRLHRRRRSAIPGFMFVALKPLARAQDTADQVIARLRGKLAKEPGANLFLQPVQDIRIGGRQANAQYQFTLQARRSRRASRVGAEDPRGAEQRCPSSPTSTPTRRTRDCRPRSSSIATPRRGSA